MLAACLLPATLAGCGRSAGGQELQVVGSSTVYPFTTVVAEQYQRNNPGRKVIVESTGTGAGMKLFCAGVGARYPDVTNASRRIKASELADCNKNGVRRVVELPIGIDGLVLVESAANPRFSLSVADVYKALAANPLGQPNRARSWRDVNPALPDLPIRVFGPPPTSGTRDSFSELIMEKGCDSFPQMKALKESDSDRHKDLCTKIREDGAYIEAGENDNLLIQKVAAAPGTVAVLGYSFLEENGGAVRGIPMGGVAPSAATIADLTYPGARQMYVYAKGEHLRVVPGMAEFLREYGQGLRPGAYLTRRGLIVSPPATQEVARRAVTEYTPLTADDLG
jgi:phosphate transport system substrate-binding protein